MYRPLWIEIDLRAVRYNFRRIKKIIGREVKVMAVLKQEAYGHGLLPLAEEFSHLGADFFGLGSLEEAIILRKNKFKQPILILSLAAKQFAGKFLEYNVTPTIADLSFARQLNREAEKRGRIFPVQVKIDTGMGRLGVWYSAYLPFIRKLRQFKNLFLEGIWTHFPAAETDRRFTDNQIKIFNNLINSLKKEKIITYF